jgi:hypothetical protein
MGDKVSILKNTIFPPPKYSAHPIYFPRHIYKLEEGQIYVLRRQNIFTG